MTAFLVDIPCILFIWFIIDVRLVDKVNENEKKTPHKKCISTETSAFFSNEFY